MILGSGFFLVSVVKISIVLIDIAFLSTIFSIIALVSLVIFHRGQIKEPDSQTLHTLVAISTKFLLELLLALAWFFVIKKTFMQAVLMFFVIYLTLTLFLVFIILRTLKNKSLQN